MLRKRLTGKKLTGLDRPRLQTWTGLSLKPLPDRISYRNLSLQFFRHPGGIIFGLDSGTRAE